MEALILVLLRKHQVIVPNYILKCTKLNMFITIQKTFVFDVIIYLLNIVYIIYYIVLLRKYQIINSNYIILCTILNMFIINTNTKQKNYYFCNI